MLYRRSLSMLVLLLICAALPLVASAGAFDNPPAQPGFTHTKFTGSDTGQGLLLSGKKIGYGSPTIAEIDDNSGNGKEIAVGGTDGMLYVYRANGQLAWSKQVAPECGAAGFPDGMISTAPAVGELFGNGVPYVVVGYGSANAGCPNGGVAAYDGRNGSLEWRHAFTSSSEALHGVYSSPGLADVDGDGKLEIGVGNFERDVIMLNSNGTRRWRHHNADTVFSSPAFTDVDNDGLLDMIIGSDISPPVASGGYVTAFRGTDGAILWRNLYDQVIYSSPSLADLDGNGTVEVVVGSGCYWSPNTRGHWLKVLNARTGAEIRQLNASSCVNSSPAIADIDGDGKLDVVALVDGSQVGKNAAVEAWSYDNPTRKWRAEPGQAIGGANDSDLRSGTRSPVIADVDGNGSLEVLVVNYNDVIVLNGFNGAQLTCNNCQFAPTPTLFAWYPLKSTPAVGDLDGDGDLEVVVGGSHNDQSSRGLLYAWTNIALDSPAGSAAPYSAPWPMFHGSALHNGFGPKLSVSVKAIGALIKQGGSARTFSIEIENTAGEAISWTATKNQPWITLSDTNGTTPDTLNITLNPSGQAQGTYSGSVSINSSLGSVTINTTMIVVDEIYQVHLPLGLR